MKASRLPAESETLAAGVRQAEQQQGVQEASIKGKRKGKKKVKQSALVSGWETDALPGPDGTFYLTVFLKRLVLAPASDKASAKMESLLYPEKELLCCQTVHQLRCAQLC